MVLHPTAPVGHSAVGFGRPSPILEFPIDTTRAVFRLILDGVIERHPRIRWIVPHSGSALAVLADRVHDVARMWHTGDGPVPDVIGALQTLHYDLAGPATPRALPALLTLVEPSRLLYGSDFPFPPLATLERFAAALEQTDALSDAEREAMFPTNALALFPRLALLLDRDWRLACRPRRRRGDPRRWGNQPPGIRLPIRRAAQTSGGGGFAAIPFGLAIAVIVSARPATTSW